MNKKNNTQKIMGVVFIAVGIFSEIIALYISSGKIMPFVAGLIIISIGAKTYLKK